jgi:hypothetical protein
MKRPWAALVTVLALSVFMPDGAKAQSTDQRQPSSGSRLGQNFPNPFNPETRIPFTIEGDPLACQSGKLFRVSARIYNLAPRLVAIPVLQGGTGTVSGGQPLENVMLPCGQYIAYWSGTDLNTGREAASGVYLYRLEVDGKTVHTRKMLNAK